MLSAALAVPVIALAMIPALQFPGWTWVSLVLASPVYFWAARRFHRSARVNLRHGATTMDTLISLGTSAAYWYSLWALLFTHAGDLHYTHPFTLTIGRADGASVYFEAVVGIVTFLLAGRWFEARARTQSSAALRALLTLGASEATRLRGGVEERAGHQMISNAPPLMVTAGPRSTMLAPCPLSMVMPASVTWIVAPEALCSITPPAGPGRSLITRRF